MGHGRRLFANNHVVRTGYILAFATATAFELVRNSYYN
jgi:hypothetical protein